MNCKVCGKSLNGRQTKFCSKSCKSKAHSKAHRKNMTSQEGMKFIVSQLELGYEFFHLGITDNNLLGLNSFTWRIHNRYIVASPTYGGASLHRIIWTFFNGDIPKDKQIDHINRNKLDNRICNLRLASPLQNTVNQNHKKNKKTSKYKGVYPTASGKWQPQIDYKYERKTLGSYDSEDKAAVVYNSWARYYYKEYAFTNIVEDSSIKPYEILEKEGEECAVYLIDGEGKLKFKNKSNICKVCPTCKKSFSSLTQNQKHCSVKCSTLSKRKVERPTKEELQKLVWEKPTTHIAKEYGVSDVAVKKWCKAYQIEKPPRGYWAKQKIVNYSLEAETDYKDKQQVEGSNPS